MRCLIIDDDPAFRKKLTGFIDKSNDLELVDCCSTTTEAYDVLENDDIQLIFLDIEVSGVSGLDFLSTLSVQPDVIMTTAQKKVTNEAFDNEIVDYLVKPVSYSRFLRAINRVSENILNGEKNTSDEFFVKSGKKLINISTEKIIYIQSKGDYMIIHTPDSDYTVTATMKDIQRELPDGFIRVHRSYIVNTGKIQFIEKNILVLPDARIPISRSYKESLMEKINFLG